MINFDAYRNQMRFPVRRDFEEMVVAISSKGERKGVKFFDEQGLTEERIAYYTENARLWKLFIVDLKKDLGIADNPKADCLIAKAESVADGDMHRLAEWCEEMVELIK